MAVTCLKTLLRQAKTATVFELEFSGVLDNLAANSWPCRRCHSCHSERPQNGVPRTRKRGLSDDFSMLTASDGVPRRSKAARLTSTQKPVRPCPVGTLESVSPNVPPRSRRWPTAGPADQNLSQVYQPFLSKTEAGKPTSERGLLVISRADAEPRFDFGLNAPVPTTPAHCRINAYVSNGGLLITLQVWIPM